MKLFRAQNHRVCVPSLTYDDAREDHRDDVELESHKNCYPFLALYVLCWVCAVPIHNPNINEMENSVLLLDGEERTFFQFTVRASIDV